MTSIVKRSPRDLSRLARDIAMDILAVEDILTMHEIDQASWEEIAGSPAFEAMLRDMRAEWLAADNTRQRVKIKAQTGVESVLETILEEITNGQIPLAQRVEALKTLVKLGELGETANAGSGGERVIIEIVTSPQAPPVTIEAKAVPSREAEDVVQ